MPAHYYRLRRAIAASLSLVLTGGLAGGLVGCGGSERAKSLADPITGKVATQPVLTNADPTDQTIWTVLGLAKREAQRSTGPQTGASVSPVLWEAAHDTLKFAGITSEDPMSGLVVTDWYSPRGKPSERLRVSVYILSRALRSDSLSVTIERQERSTAGQWSDTTVARDVVTGLENAILLRARQIHAERYRSTM